MKYIFISFEELAKTEIHNNVTELIFPHWFNQEIKENVLPLSLTYLTFGSASDFNQEIKERVLPPSLIHLKFGFRFNQKVKEDVLPHSLTHLTFGNSFNQEIKEGVLPPSLTHLKFGYDFNQEIKEGVLPPSLTHITFGMYSSFNRKIKEGGLPISLEYFQLTNYNYGEQLRNLLDAHKQWKANLSSLEGICWNILNDEQKNQLPEMLRNTIK